MSELADGQDLGAEYLELGRFYLLYSKFEEAIVQLKKAAELKSDDPLVYYDLGISYEGLNMNDEAKQNFRKALELDPNLKEAEEHLDKLIGV